MPRDHQPASTTPTSLEVTLVTAGTEYPEIIRDDDDGPSVKKILIRSRTSESLQFAYVTGGPYITVGADQAYWDDGLDTRHLTIFVKGSADGQIAEVLYWI